MGGSWTREANRQQWKDAKVKKIVAGKIHTTVQESREKNKEEGKGEKQSLAGQKN